MKIVGSEVDHNLQRALAELQTVSERDPHKARYGRAAYLSEVKGLLKERSQQEAVSRNPFQRLNGWINSFPKLTQRKERSPMFTVISTMMMVAALLFGGAGATVYAAQGSLPDQLLYPVKTLSEEMRLGLSADSENQMQLALSFANRRTEELAAMQQKGQVPPEELVTRLQLQLNLALQLAAGMEDAHMQQALLQARSVIRSMEQMMTGLGETSGQEEAILAQVREVLRNQYRLCELGLQAPAQLRVMFKNQNQQKGEPPVVPPTEPPATGNQQNGAGDGIGECTDCTPVQDGTGPGPGPSAGAGADNGTGGCTDCIPIQDGSGPGPNNDPGSQGGSDIAPGSGGCTDCTPAADGGSGSGPGSGNCTDCNPGQDSSGPGSGPNNEPGTGSGSSGQGGSGKP